MLLAVCVCGKKVLYTFACLHAPGCVSLWMCTYTTMCVNCMPVSVCVLSESACSRGAHGVTYCPTGFINQLLLRAMWKHSSACFQLTERHSVADVWRLWVSKHPSPESTLECIHIFILNSFIYTYSSFQYRTIPLSTFRRYKVTDKCILKYLLFTRTYILGNFLLYFYSTFYSRAKSQLTKRLTGLVRKAKVKSREAVKGRQTYPTGNTKSSQSKKTLEESIPGEGKGWMSLIHGTKIH